MTFPVYITVFSYRIHPHTFFDFIAYSGGFRYYLYQQKRIPGEKPNAEKKCWIFIGCLFGALIGAKVVAWLEAPRIYWLLRMNLNAWLMGKSIVGALLGGWGGVEMAKKLVRVTYSTGDAMVYPLLFGMTIGRIGCFLTGISDSTFGVPTHLPWGVDFGDGIPRHPTQLYEMFCLITIAAGLRGVERTVQYSGQFFRLFLMVYFCFRFSIEFIKPRHLVFMGLSSLQLFCLAGGLLACYSFRSLIPAPGTAKYG